MNKPVIIYSPETIRGNILLKTFKWYNIDAMLSSKIFEVQEIIKKINPNFVIIDTVKYFLKVLPLVLSLKFKIPEQGLYILVELTDIPTLESYDINRKMCFTEPIDPESILYKIRQKIINYNKYNDNSNVYDNSFLKDSIINKNDFDNDKINLPPLLINKKTSIIQKIINFIS